MMVKGVWRLPTDRVPLETEEQQDFIRWFRRTYPGVRIFHIPNGEKRSKAAGLKLKNIGVSKGVPDLFVPARRWMIWLEFKRQDAVPSDTDADQLSWHEYLRAEGYTVKVVNGSHHAQDEVDAFVIAHGLQEYRAE